MEPVDLDRHCAEVLTRMARGSVVPFLGAGVNRCGRPDGQEWNRDSYLPDGGELSMYFADTYKYPGPDPHDLGRVSQYVELELREMALYTDLRDIFTGAYGPNEVHRLLAELPAAMKERGQPPPFQLVVTTNYDDALEQAFREAGQAFDLVYYAAATEQKPGEFMHMLPDGPVPVTTHYRNLTLEERPAILKIHGAVDRDDETRDSYVVTEDHYIDYLARTNLDQLIPVSVMREMRTSHILFLGYGLRDWNLRVILKHVWSEQPRRGVSWAVQRAVDDIDRMFWSREGVNVVVADLLDWVQAIRRNLPPAPA